ncbi:hypothetical protein BDQ17DRAFT_1340520 [Cyathus striatus]|nr:hypothetical protein BDQ17DRAFT_1340520 [Cyathus striatus]
MASCVMDSDFKSEFIRSSNSCQILSSPRLYFVCNSPAIPPRGHRCPPTPPFLSLLFSLSLLFLFSFVMSALHSTSKPRPSLDYLRSSPVRAQLEPYDPSTPSGWRYIQTTDTFDELKVLLPPETASMYEQLLNLEKYELSKRTSVAWERILEIRHLKDRMIRKCHKLAKTIPPASRKTGHSSSFSFQSFIAPSDFRRPVEACSIRPTQTRPTPARTSTLNYPYCCARCTAAAFPTDHSPATHGPHHPSFSSSRVSLQRAVTNPAHVKMRPPMQHRAPIANAKAVQRLIPQRSMSLSVKPASVVSSPPSVASVASPKPLPILLRGQREEYGLDVPAKQVETISSNTTSPDPSKEDQKSITASPLHSQDVLPAQPQLRRRRSCIRRNSVDGVAKTVSWADDQEWDQQLSKYASTARAIQASGKWDEVRVLYAEQMDGLESLHNQVRQGLEQLCSETKHLLNIEETIRGQRETLQTTFRDLEQKQGLLKEKVQEALNEASGVLANAGTTPRRELHAIVEA